MVNQGTNPGTNQHSTLSLCRSAVGVTCAAGTVQRWPDIFGVLMLSFRVFLLEPRPRYDFGGSTAAGAGGHSLSDGGGSSAERRCFLEQVWASGIPFSHP